MPLSDDTKLLIVKIVSLVLLLFVSLFVTFIPIFMSRLSWLKRRMKFMRMIIRVMDFFSGLSGGVLFGGALLHLIPDSSKRISDAIRNIVVNNKGKEHVWFVDYPWSPLFASLSLATIYFLEKILVKFIVYFIMKCRMKRKKSNVININTNDDASTYYKFENEEDKPNEKSPVTPIDANDQLQFTEISMVSLLNAIVLWLSLTIHALFESLGLGSVSDMKQMWTLLVAILSHKFVEAFILGRTIAKGFESTDRMNWKQISSIALFVVSFSLASPVGVGIGIGISRAGAKKYSDQFDLVSGIFLALASGAFLYVSMFEIMAEGHDHDHNAHGEEDSHNHSDHPKNPI